MPKAGTQWSGDEVRRGVVAPISVKCPSGERMNAGFRGLGR